MHGDLIKLKACSQDSTSRHRSQEGISQNDFDRDFSTISADGCLALYLLLSEVSSC